MYDQTVTRNQPFVQGDTQAFNALLDRLGVSGGIYDAAGMAATLVAAHEAAEDPHPAYLTQEEGDAAYAPVLGGNDNYVTDAEKTKLSNLSGTNTGDQDLSGYALLTDLPLTSASAALGADVSLTTSGTWYDGPSVSLAAGTWLVNATVTLNRTDATAVTYFSRITDGTTHYASTQAYQAAVADHSDSVSLSAVITLVGTTTIKAQSTTDAGAATALMKAATTANGSGNNATQIVAVKIA